MGRTGAQLLRAPEETHWSGECTIRREEALGRTLGDCTVVREAWSEGREREGSQ